MNTRLRRNNIINPVTTSPLPYSLGISFLITPFTIQFIPFIPIIIPNIHRKTATFGSAVNGILSYYICIVRIYKMLYASSVGSAVYRCGIQVGMNTPGDKNRDG